MKDLTLLYYTANLVEEPFGTNVRNHLLSLFPEGIPLISISHKPIDFGENIHVEGYEPSIYNIYRQILIGAKAAKTRFVACCEDDSLLNREHLSFRPAGDCFAYNINRWTIDHNIFFHRKRVNMSMCIAPTDLMIDTLEKRFEKFPNVMSREEMGAAGGFGEPGKFEAAYGLPSVKMVTFATSVPTIVFNHRGGVGGLRKIMKTDHIKEELPVWGKAEDVWKGMYGRRI